MMRPCPHHPPRLYYVLHDGRISTWLRPGYPGTFFGPAAFDGGLSLHCSVVDPTPLEASVYSYPDWLASRRFARYRRRSHRPPSSPTSRPCSRAWRSALLTSRHNSHYAVSMLRNAPPADITAGQWQRACLRAELCAAAAPRPSSFSMQPQITSRRQHAVLQRLVSLAAEDIGVR
ncbi:hypothetical protein OH76DRAFT_178198 [Lentinus brumalis]|uniref:Uncharacterized protein n=1 Tax=Lentinus brumalis TaxID=2498619 RepID=A0A371CNK3_9APHY|nr:hypothetical protein OH76DRAFT_178198 [Polyporus brumalis]